MDDDEVPFIIQTPREYIRPQHRPQQFPQQLPQQLPHQFPQWLPPHTSGLYKHQHINPEDDYRHRGEEYDLNAQELNYRPQYGKKGVKHLQNQRHMISKIPGVRGGKLNSQAKRREVHP